MEEGTPGDQGEPVAEEVFSDKDDGDNCYGSGIRHSKMNSDKDAGDKDSSSNDLYGSYVYK